MNKRIWKFQIDSESKIIVMPDGAEILTVQVINQVPCIYVLVNPDARNTLRRFEIYETGEDIAFYMSTSRKYINTYQLNDGKLVLHLFEKII